MAAWCAKLFGFRSNIAHGMLLLARFVSSAQAAGALAAGAHFRICFKFCHLKAVQGAPLGTLYMFNC